MTDNELPEKVDPVEDAPEEEQKGDDSFLVLAALAGFAGLLWYVNKRAREAGGSSPAAVNTSGLGGRVAAVGIAALDERRAKYGPLPPVNVRPGTILPTNQASWGKLGGEKLH